MKLKCIKDVVMNNDGSIAFSSGATYEATKCGTHRVYATNNQGGKRHYIRDLENEEFFNKHFVEIKTQYVQTLNDYQNLSKRTMNSDQTYKEELSNYGLGLSGESGEVCDLLKKSLYHGHKLDIEHLKKELGDVLFYLTAIATKEGLTLEEIANVNIEKLLKRYPDGFSQEKSINRSE